MKREIIMSLNKRIKSNIGGIKMKTIFCRKMHRMSVIVLMIAFAGGLFADNTNIPKSVQQQINLNAAKVRSNQIQDITKNGVKTGHLPNEFQKLEKVKTQTRLSSQAIPTKNRKSPISVNQSMEIAINANATRDFYGFFLGDDTLAVGSDVLASWTPSADPLYIYQYWDSNSNGVLDTMDVPMDMFGPFMDNDFHDECADVGSYCVTLNDGMLRGMNRIIGDFIYVLAPMSSSESYDELPITFYAEPGILAISGTVTNLITSEPMPGIPVWIDFAFGPDGPQDNQDNGPMLIDITDEYGNYELPVYDFGNYLIVSDDYLQLYDNLIAETPVHEFYVDASVSDLNFQYRAPLCFISGTVSYDQAPLLDVEVFATGDFLADRMAVVDDATGTYTILVDPGFFWVRLNPQTVLPIYMMPSDLDVYVDAIGASDVNFMLHETNSFISGTFNLNGLPFDGAQIYAFGDNEWSVAQSMNGGEFYLDVRDNSPMNYMLHVELPIMGHFVLENPNNYVPPGTSGLVLNAITVDGGIQGYFYDANSGDVIYHMVGLSAYNIDTNQEYFTGPSYSDGMYQLYLPDGNYTLNAGGEFYESFFDSLTINGQMIDFDITLNPIAMNSSIEGYVYNDSTLNPIPNAQIDIMGPNWGTSLLSDNSGYFYTDLPNGYYDMMISAPGYSPYWESFDVYDEMYSNDFYLQAYDISAQLYGNTYNVQGDVLPYVAIYIQNDNYQFYLNSDFEGYYQIGLPAGMYHVEAWSTDMGIMGYAWVDSVYINGQDVNLDIYLEGPDYRSAAYGVVVDNDTGEPLPDVIVAASHFGFNNDEPEFWTFTNSDGEYWLDLENGEYDMVAFSESYEIMFIDNIMFEDDTLNFDFNLMPFTGSISGYVNDEFSNPISYAWIYAFEETDSLSRDFYTETDEFGYYHLPVQNGNYTVIAGYFEYQDSWVYNINVLDEDVTVDFVLAPWNNDWMPPQISCIQDQMNDQGRWVRMEFFPGHAGWNDPYQGYSVWREIPFVDCDCYDFVTYVPFHNDDYYSLVVPTLIDSNTFTTQDEMYWTGFKVSGHYGMWDFMDSGMMYGYSVDNIHPMPVGGFAVLNAGVDGVELVWEMNVAEDFQYYEIFRAINGNINNAESIGLTGALGFIDANVELNNSYDYFVRAVDANGNASESSNVVTVNIVSTEETGIPHSYALNQNYPNPFNPTTQISFALPEASSVELVIYNVRGQVVRSLSNTEMNAGYYALTWDGLDNNGALVSSGVYITTLKAGQFKSSNKMILLR